MINVKFISIEGKFNVSGIYNYNGSGQKDGNNNHKYAKQDKNGIDFTSSRCLRHEMFKDLQPQQPASREFADYFLDIAASEVGLLRGYLAADTGFKRASPIHVADAYTDATTSIIFSDQGSSSKPKEANKTGKAGKQVSDTSIFSQDNAPDRKQKLSAAINIKELQFLNLDNFDSGFRMVSAEDEEKFVAKLQAYFKDHGVEHALEIKEFNDQNAVLAIKRRGVLLSDPQIRHLISVTLSRLASIDGIKSGARIKSDIPSISVTLSDGLESKTFDLKQFKDEVKIVSFQKFYNL